MVRIELDHGRVCRRSSSRSRRPSAMITCIIGSPSNMPTVRRQSLGRSPCAVARSKRATSCFRVATRSSKVASAIGRSPVGQGHHVFRDSTALWSLGQWEVPGVGRKRPHRRQPLPGAVATGVDHAALPLCEDQTRHKTGSVSPLPFKSLTSANSIAAFSTYGGSFVPPIGHKKGRQMAREEKQKLVSSL